MEMKRKTPLQAKALLKFYLEEKYPTKSEMESLAAALDLTYKQVRTWFVEKRRRDKGGNGIVVPSSSRKKLAGFRGRNGLGVVAARIAKKQDSLICNKHLSLVVCNETGKKKNTVTDLQDLLTPNYILKKVFRKDGPPLGVEFDSLPSQAFFRCKDSRNSCPAVQENQTAKRKRKVSIHDELDYRELCANKDPVRKHGRGKGLMTAWRVMNPNGGTVPTGIDVADRQVTVVPQMETPVSRKPPLRKKRAQQIVSLLKQRRVANNLQNKRKPLAKGRQVKLDKGERLRQPHKEKCKLALDGVMSQERLDQIAMLVDDEELELRELEAGPNPLTCCDHFSTKGLYGCSLCRDLLAKFPPNSVKMKQPFGTQPWDSSPETVKKLFKVFHFLYTYAGIVDICSFTLDEFAQAFHDKDSLLLGKIHVALLKLLLSDVETELGRGCLPHLSVSCKFLALLHSVENQEFFVEFWNKSLNPLTWTEILRQVLVAAGFGSKKGSSRKESLSKEMILMLKYGLQPRTLKGELFRILLDQGNNGYKVCQLARSSQVAELNLASTAEEVELLISSTLSSDITLFEKIASSTYRLRINSSMEADDFESDAEDIGSVDDNSDDDDTCSNRDDSECSENHCQRRPNYLNCGKSKNNMLTVYTEIDESHRGEVWLLGLMEGEYSDLTIDEKLNALVGLIDLVSAGSSIRMEDPTRAIAESVPSVRHYGSGAKIKRALPNLHSLPRPSWVHAGDLHGVRETNTSRELHPVDSFSLLSKSCGKEKSSTVKDARVTEVSTDLHSMQSIYLGSDRRYNRYWLFLGPCNEYDPGHKRVYFESSEDGHWEVIDTGEALCALLSVLDDSGRREALLMESLEKREAFLCQAMSSRLVNNTEIRHVAQSHQSELDIVREDSSSPVSDVDNNLALIGKETLPSCGAIVLDVGKKGEEQHRTWSRLQEFDAWIWNSFYLNLNAVKHGKRSYLDALARCERCHDLYWRDEKHCKICHTTFELDFDLEERYAIHAATCRGKGDHLVSKHKILSSQLQSLKAAVHAIESVMPEDALVGAWTKSAHKLWVKRLRRTSSLAELLQVVTDFVSAINEGWLYQWSVQIADTIMEEIIACFPTMPQTSSALALWLVKLDAIIAPYLERVNSGKEDAIRMTCTGKQALVL